MNVNRLLILILNVIFLVACNPAGGEKSSKKKVGGLCVGNNCVDYKERGEFQCSGFAPLNSRMCPGVDQDLSHHVLRNLVNSCGVVKCSYECKEGFFAHNGTCVEDSNNPPKIDVIADQVITLGNAWTLDVNDGGDDKDKDNTDLIYACYVDSIVDGNVSSPALSCQDAGIAFDRNTGVLSYTPTEVKILEVKVIANDGQLQAGEIFKLSVDAGNANPPVIDSIRDKVLTIGQRVVIDANDGGDDKDRDGNTLSYSCHYDETIDGIVIQPAFYCSNLGVNFNQATGEFTLEPNKVGVFEFKIIANDGEFLDGEIFKITVVSDDNKAPSLDQVGRKKVIVNQAISAININDAGDDLDADGHSLSYACSIYPGPINRMYLTFLGREVEYRGFKYWNNMLLNGTPMLNIINTVSQSNEFQGRFGNLSDTDFIIKLHRDILNKIPGQPAIDFWLNSLASGHSRAQVAWAFANNAEYISSLTSSCGAKGISFNSTSGVMNWTPSETGSYELEITATDSHVNPLSDTMGFIIDVYDNEIVYGNISLNPVDDQTVSINGTVSLDITDVDNDKDSEGNDLEYTCQYDKVIDGNVSDTASSCTSLGASFNNTQGIFSYTSNQEEELEVKITGENGLRSAYIIFKVSFTQLISLNEVTDFTKYLNQSINININNGADDKDTSGNDITYSCQYDSNLDGNVLDSASSCENIPGINFQAPTGFLYLSSSSEKDYEFKITGRSQGGSDSIIFKARFIQRPPSEYNCIGNIPDNAIACTDYDWIQQDFPIVLTSSCTAARVCEYKCEPGFVLKENECIAATIPTIENVSLSILEEGSSDERVTIRLTGLTIGNVYDIVTNGFSIAAGRFKATQSTQDVITYALAPNIENNFRVVFHGDTYNIQNNKDLLQVSQQALKYTYKGNSKKQDGIPFMDSPVEVEAGGIGSNFLGLEKRSNGTIYFLTRSGIFYREGNVLKMFTPITKRHPNDFFVSMKIVNDIVYAAMYRNAQEQYVLYRYNLINSQLKTIKTFSKENGSHLLDVIAVGNDGSIYLRAKGDRHIVGKTQLIDKYTSIGNYVKTLYISNPTESIRPDVSFAHGKIFYGKFSFHNNKLYIPYQNNVYILNSAGGTLGEIKGNGNASVNHEALYRPQYTYVDGSNIYIVDQKNGIAKFSMDGQFLSRIGKRTLNFSTLDYDYFLYTNLVTYNGKLYATQFESQLPNKQFVKRSLLYSFAANGNMISRQNLKDLSYSNQSEYEASFRHAFTGEDGKLYLIKGEKLISGVKSHRISIVKRDPSTGAQLVRFSKDINLLSSTKYVVDANASGNLFIIDGAKISLLNSQGNIIRDIFNIANHTGNSTEVISSLRVLGNKILVTYGNKQLIINMNGAVIRNIHPSIEVDFSKNVHRQEISFHDRDEKSIKVLNYDLQNKRAFDYQGIADLNWTPNNFFLSVNQTLDNNGNIWFIAKHQLTRTTMIYKMNASAQSPVLMNEFSFPELNKISALDYQIVSLHDGGIAVGNEIFYKIMPNGELINKK